MAVEWCLAAFIWLDIRRRGMQLRQLIGRSWPSVGPVLRDLGIAVLSLIAANLVLAALGFLLKVTPNPGLRSIFPTDQRRLCSGVNAPTGGAVCGLA
jgi:hypothetical protein